jgi:protein phosphatase
VDATNVQAQARRQLLRAAAEAGVPAVALVLDLPRELVLERNARRERTVPEATVHGQLVDLCRAAVPGTLESEGFATVIRIEAADTVDGVEVFRVRC